MGADIVAKERILSASKAPKCKELSDYTFWGFSLQDSLDKIGGDYKLTPFINEESGLYKIRATFNSSSYHVYGKSCELLESHETIAKNFVGTLKSLKYK